MHVKLGLDIPLGSHWTQHASYIIYVMKRLRNIFRELWKTGSHPGLNWGPLTLAVSALPPELWPPGDSQPSCTCTCILQTWPVCTICTCVQYISIHHLDHSPPQQQIKMCISTSLWQVTCIKPWLSPCIKMSSNGIVCTRTCMYTYSSKNKYTFYTCTLQHHILSPECKVEWSDQNC